MKKLTLKRLGMSNNIRQVEAYDENGTTVSFIAQKTESQIITSKEKFDTKDNNTDKSLGVLYPTDNSYEGFKSYYALNSNIRGDDMIGPSGNFNGGLCQYKDSIVGLKLETLNGIQTKITDDTYFPIDNNLTVYKRRFATMTTSEFEGLSAEQFILSGMPFAHIHDIPTDNVTYDFDRGYMYTTYFQTQSFLDNNYNMSGNIDIPNETITVENTRTYRKCGVSDDTLWLSWQPDMSYSGSWAPTVVSSVVRPEQTFNNEIQPFHFLSANTSADPLWLYEQLTNVQNYNNPPVSVSISATDSLLKSAKYQFIEKIEGVTIETQVGHKSNVFSLRIKNAGINERITDVTLKKNVQDGFKNVIRNLIDKIKPAHTTLWKIEFTGQ